MPNLRAVLRPARVQAAPSSDAPAMTEVLPRSEADRARWGARGRGVLRSSCAPSMETERKRRTERLVDVEGTRREKKTRGSLREACAFGFGAGGVHADRVGARSHPGIGVDRGSSIASVGFKKPFKPSQLWTPLRVRDEVFSTGLRSRRHERDNPLCSLLIWSRGDCDGEVAPVSCACFFGGLEHISLYQGQVRSGASRADTIFSSRAGFICPANRRQGLRGRAAGFYNYSGRSEASHVRRTQALPVRRRSQNQRERQHRWRR